MAQIIALTPVRNEAWILDYFLRATSLWADHIVIVDHESTDGSYELAMSHPKTTVVRYEKPDFDEPQRRSMLIEEARKIPGDKVLVAIDTDEFLSWDGLQSNEWQRVKSADPGTVFRIIRYGLRKPGPCYWEEGPFDFALVDDGTPFKTSAIHGNRMAMPDGCKPVLLHDIKMMHYQYMNWPRMRSKHDWYQCWELLNTPDKRPLVIYRQYHHMDPQFKRRLPQVPDAWLNGYSDAGVNIRDYENDADLFWWDREVVQMMADRGPEHFRKLAIWDRDWNAVAQKVGLKDVDFSDPRSLLDKLVQKFLSATQAHGRNWLVRGVQQLFRPFGW